MPCDPRPRLRATRSYELAVQYTRRAVELNPNNQWNAADSGSDSGLRRRAGRGADWFSKAREIDPYFDVPWYWREAGLAHMNLRRYADALSSLSQARARRTRYAALTAGCHARLGDMDACESQCRRVSLHETGLLDCQIHE